jgi:hypothetical protein
MSIEAHLTLLCEGGQLWPIGRADGIRRMFVCREVLVAVSRPFDKGTPGRALLAMRQRLDQFTEGGVIPFGWDPKQKKPSAIFARVAPVELGVVSIRVTYKDQGVRVFGCLARPDWYVGMHWEFRDDVGDFGKQAQKCRRDYEDLVGRSPHVGNDPDEYFTLGKLVV